MILPSRRSVRALTQLIPSKIVNSKMRLVAVVLFVMTIIILILILAVQLLVLTRRIAQLSIKMVTVPPVTLVTLF